MGGFIFDEQNFINNNAFKFEDRLNSQVARFLDKSPTYVTYYHISDIESTVDLGFSNIDGLLGDESPLRFNEIKDFPVYGLDPVQLRLEDMDQGLDTSYEGELLILPNTIKPTPNDFFTINYMSKDFIFMVTGVDYDTVKSNNYYKIDFSVKDIDYEVLEKLKMQVTDKYTCINTNIGTDDKAIIQSDLHIALKQVKELYNNIAERYKMYFYKDKYNSFIFKNRCGYRIYDRYLSAFMQKHRLFNNKDDHMTIMVNNEDETEDFLFEYDKSIYKLLELKRPDLIKRYAFSVVPIQNQYSVFSYYGDIDVCSIRFRRGEFCYIHEPFTTAIKSGNLHNPPCNHTMENLLPCERNDKIVITNKFVHDECPMKPFDEMDKLIIYYMHDKIKSIYDINIDKINELLFFDYSWENFIKIPLFLFVVRKIYNKFLNTDV